MDRSLVSIDRQPVPTTSDRWSPTSDAECLGRAPAPTMLEAGLIARVSFNGALNEAAKWSGKEDQDIAAEIHICAGYMSRAMRGIWQQWAKRLVLFMRATNSLAPVQWIAHQVGCDLVVRASSDARIRELEAELRELTSPRRLA